MAELAIGFTAARELDDQGGEVILNVFAGLPHADCYVTGGAIGGDSFIGRWLFRNRPGAEHVVIVPANKSRVDPWWLYVSGPVTVIPMPAGGTYKDRNGEIVKRAAMMYGFPAYPEDDPRALRSGTWQTIRMARSAGKLSQWACVKPPYKGRIEKYPSGFSVTAGRIGTDE